MTSYQVRLSVVVFFLFSQLASAKLSVSCLWSLKLDGFCIVENPGSEETVEKLKDLNIQSQFMTEDGGFHCIPRSHLRFDDYAPRIEKMDSAEEKHQYLLRFFNTYMDEDLNSYFQTYVKVKKGSLVLWDPRIVRWN